MTTNPVDALDLRMLNGIRPDGSKVERPAKSKGRYIFKANAQGRRERFRRLCQAYNNRLRADAFYSNDEYAEANESWLALVETAKKAQEQA